MTRRSASTNAQSARTTIAVQGARVHNLKNISLEIPRDSLVVVTGLSGSGKSSLAFDTIYAEGQRRYMESLSSYAKRFVAQVAKPDVDFIFGLSPVISIEQKTLSNNPRSTVGTMTDIASYLNLLFATIGQARCPRTGEPVPTRSASQVLEAILSLPAGTEIELRAPVFKVYGEDLDLVFTELRKKGCRRVIVDGSSVDIAAQTSLDESAVRDMDAIVDRFVVNRKHEKAIKAGVAAALLVGDGLMQVHVVAGAGKAEAEKFYRGVSSATHHLIYGDIGPSYFVFNDPESACRTCGGLGVDKLTHPELLIPDPRRSIRGGCFVKEAFRYNPDTWDGRVMYSLSKSLSFSLDTPWKELKEKARSAILYGIDPKKVVLTSPPEAKVKRDDHEGKEAGFNGIARRIERWYRRYRQRGEANSRMEEWLDKVMVEHICPDCNGARLRATRLLFTIEGKNIHEMGPGPGVHGGTVVVQGTFADVLESKASPTGQFLSGKRSIAMPKQRRNGAGRTLTVRGARENNLKNVDVEIPLGKLVAITGASGSGKSSLVNEIIYKALWKRLVDTRTLPGEHDALDGAEHVHKVVNIDQSPIGRNSRSNPATYIGFYDTIRDLFTQAPLSVERGYKAGRFSFNVKGGRCEECQGEGAITTQLYFMPDVEVTCGACKGARFNSETLEVTLRGKTIDDVLNMSVEEGVAFFSEEPNIRKKIQVLADLGLGYLTLGQSGTTLSGGEAQRIKIATELSVLQRSKHTLYILDEPTTGLHLADVERLLESLNRLVDAGHTVLLIEHHLDVIKTADHVIDLGPDGGHAGGAVVVAGTPEDVAKCKASHTGRFLKAHLRT